MMYYAKFLLCKCSVDTPTLQGEFYSRRSIAKHIVGGTEKDQTPETKPICSPCSTHGFLPFSTLNQLFL